MAGIPSWARPGVKVVCVDDVPLDAYGKHLARGERYEVNNGSIYTIDYVEIDLGSVWLGFEETHEEDCYDIAGFRPLKEADLEHFKHLLTPINDLSDETLAGELALDAANGRAV